MLHQHGLASGLVVGVDIDKFNVISLTQHHRFEPKPLANVYAWGGVGVLSRLENMLMNLSIHLDSAMQIGGVG